MAVAYRVVVSSLNYYSSVVIDRRTQHAVHYCTGPCQLLTHGLDCTVDHRSACAELLDAAVSPMPVATVRPSATHSLLSKFAALGNRGFPVTGAEAMMEEYYQALQDISSARKSLTVQAFSSNLKDITGEAINLASGKVKEFSQERDRFSPGHSLFRKSRKVRPDSLLSRFFTGNEENSPCFRLPPSEDPLCPEPSTGEATAAFHLNSIAEEGLVARILEKAKTEGGSPGQDMRACLEVLLCCSEDLRKCTDIIRQCCIRRKSGDASDYGGTEMAYRSAMARLSGYLKKLPFWFGMEQDQPWRHEQSDLAELLRSLQRQQQQSNLFSCFRDELPPRYEDVVLGKPAGNAEPIPNLLASPSPAASPTSSAPRQGKVTATILLNHTNSLSFVSSAVLTMKKPSAITAPEERLYIEEKVDGGKMAGGGVGGEGMFSRALVEVSKDNAPKPGAANNLLRRVADETQAPSSLEPMLAQQTTWGRGSGADSEEMDKLLTDFEQLSRSIAKEALSKVKGLVLRNGSQQAGAPHQHPTCESGNRTQGGPPRPPSQIRQNPGRTASGSCEEVDGALLQRILDSIESLAQELMESGAGGAGRAGPLSRKGEVMRILRGTLVTPTETAAEEGPNSDHTPGTGPLAVLDPATPRDCISTLSIQQTPEVIIRIQNKQDEESLASPSIPDLATTPTSVPDSLTSTTTSSPPPLQPVEKGVVSAPVSINIPRFYFTAGLLPNCSADLDQTIAKIETAFAGLQEQKADIYEMGKIAKVCGCPLYWKAALFYGAGGDRTTSVSTQVFVAMWRKLLHSCYDDSTKFVYLLAKPGCKYLEQEDFIPLLQDIVDTHPGLTFLKDAPEFHSRYITTVIQRIFYTVNRSWTGRVTVTELRRSNFLQTLALLEEEEDINLITDYFSYEHFYVIYVKFWELDANHDLFINQKDLGRYNDHALSNKIIERLFSGAVMKGGCTQREGKMSYAEFVWYLISEEDKKNVTSIEYWFRCMDLDGDGVLSMYELQFFYNEQCKRMETMGIEPLPFSDLLCQMLDLVKPKQNGKITLGDLKRCQMAHIFYDTFINLEKYLDHEQRDPFAVQKDMDSDVSELSDWEKFAADEYEVLVAEDTASDPPLDGYFEDGCESEECMVTSGTGNKVDKTEEIVISNLSV